MSDQERIKALEQQVSDLAFRLEVTEDVQSRLGKILFDHFPHVHLAYKALTSVDSSDKTERGEVNIRSTGL